MYQAIQKSKLLIRSVRAITQSANCTPCLIPSFGKNGSAICFSTASSSFNPSNIQNPAVEKKSSESRPRGRVNRSHLKSYVQDSHIPQYTPNIDSISNIVTMEFRSNLSKARNYLTSARSLDVNHMRAVAFMEMSAHNFDEARSILRPLYRLYPENEDILADLCMVEDGAGNDQAFVQYTRALKRLKNRKSALAAETQSSKPKTIHDRQRNTYNRTLVEESEEVEEGPVNVDDLTFLSHEEERDVRRTLYSEALLHSPKKADMVIEWAKEEAEHGYIDKAIALLRHAISFYDTPAEAGILNVELAKYYYFLNNIPKSTEALKTAMRNPAVKPIAINQMAEMSELVESQEAALEMYQYAVDQENSDAQTWKYYLDYLKAKDLNDLYKKVAAEALVKFPDSRVLNAHYVASLVKNKEYDAVLSAMENMINKNPTSVFTYEYLLSACDTIADPRILNTIYYYATQNIKDNSFLFTQYGEFLEEMNEYEGAKEMFRQAYNITPNDDLARSIIRMAIELGDYQEANTLLDALIDQYSSEVEFRGNKVMWNRDANKAYRFIHREGETEDEFINQDYDDLYRDEQMGLFGTDRKVTPPVDDDEYYQTTHYMMPRLLTEKAIIASRMQKFDYAERLFENAMELDPSDPFIILNAIEEYYEPSEQWDKIIYLFSILPIVDPNHEFMEEARSLRQSILETIQDTEASNKQIYDLYNLPDNSNPMERHETVDYFGRDVHQHSNINDGFNRFGYQHMNQVDAEHDKELAQFNSNYDNRMNLEDLPVNLFYSKVPESLMENYSNTNWYEMPIMKEWMTSLPDETASESVDWNLMRNSKGALQIPYSSVFDAKDKIKVSMKDLENLRNLLSKEYTTVHPAMKEGMKDQEHVYDLKTQEQLIKEIRKNLGEAYFDWSYIDGSLQYPVEKEDFALSHLLNDSLKRYSRSKK